VRLSPLGTSATNRATVPASDDRWWWWWMWSSQWNENRQGKSKYSEKSCPSVTWAAAWEAGDHSSGGYLSYGTAKCSGKYLLKPLWSVTWMLLVSSAKQGHIFLKVPLQQKIVRFEIWRFRWPYYRAPTPNLFIRGSSRYDLTFLWVWGPVLSWNQILNVFSRLWH
jgi:hypothetical protein